MSDKRGPEPSEPPRWKLAERAAHSAERAYFPAIAVRVPRRQLSSAIVRRRLPPA
ncbi:MAG: hypothetical protein ABI140_19855 [Jatrophihabitantaceae bacterium]